MVGFPLLLVPLAVYNIIAFLMPGVSFTDPLIEADLAVGRTVADHAQRHAARRRRAAVAARGHQGRAPRREISHRPSAVADRVRRRRRRIRALAEIRQLDLLPADAAGAGRFHFRNCVAHPPPCGNCACCARPERQQAAARGTARPRLPCSPHSRLEPAPVAAPAPAAPPPAAPVPSATSVAESVLLDPSAPKPTVAFAGPAAGRPPAIGSAAALLKTSPRKCSSWFLVCA